ncbi:unnamed protein product [Rotaria magnacalcarata]|uniref:Endonuclease/exonuclease/phosphatase domain-containing protein n=1 Tax=Rotaria magnacalcarata TaxID=392030 RepID=A0A816RJ56_9BILA|nr:unnamed protein product [Rotaria magnacalcarata]CAF4336441.1 unnamed protein product [Rotaria magnacalcarata]
MILYHYSINCKLSDSDTNFILIEISLSNETLYVGGLHVPPNSLPPFQLLSKHQNKSFYIFGDLNAKHTEWRCTNNNASGVRILNWLEVTGNELIVPQKATSKRSDSIIDFGITRDATGWTSEVLNEGTSDHYPILFQSSIAVDENSFFRLTNWKLFTFFLSAIYEYWLSIIYNLDEQTFFNLFSLFLASLWDSCSTYETITKYRPPWPPHLVLMAKSVNRVRRKYRRNRNSVNLQYFLTLKELFITERNHIIQSKAEKNISWATKGQNIWKFVKPYFHSFTPPFRGLAAGTHKVTNLQDIADTVADFFEIHFQKPKHDVNKSVHVDAIISYNQIEYTSNVPLEQITLNEVLNE